MSPEQIVRDVLAAAPAVTALVSTRIYPDEIPQGGALPAIVYIRAGTQPVFTLDDTLAKTKATMRVNCWAETRLAAEALGDAAQGALVAASHMPIGRDGFLDPETNHEASIMDVEVWL